MPPKSASKSNKKNALPAKAKDKGHHLLIEIGTEELPANYLAYGNAEEQALFRNAFVEGFRDVYAAGEYDLGPLRILLTPRRIILEAPSVECRVKQSTETVYGPPADKAYTPDGKPTPMLEGFLKSKNIDLKDVRVFENKGKQCIGFERHVQTVALDKSLQAILDGFVRRLRFPKWMWWDDSGFRFPRPVRTLLCLLDDKLQKLSLGTLKASTAIRTFEHGQRKTYSVSSAAAYWSALKKAGIVADQSERLASIRKKVEELTKKAGGVYLAQTTLLEEVTYLTENPYCIQGKFDETFAGLPPEVLTSSLSRSQRLFSVVDSSGKHHPSFIGVLDGMPASAQAIVGTVASILKAKLQDSHFFYKEDMKLYAPDSGGKNYSGIQKLKDQSKNLLFLKGFGSMDDKAQRLVHVFEKISKQSGIHANLKASVLQAIPYMKIDLLTQMVGEFPELQGVMGKYYLRESKFPIQDPGAVAIGEQYLPLSADGALPTTPAGAMLSLLDKVDLIVACFTVGKIPTSSQDPYALKRSFAAVLRIVAAYEFDFSWKELVQAYLDEAVQQKFLNSNQVQQVAQALQEFYAERSGYFYQNAGFDADLVAAVLASDANRLLTISKKIEGLAGIQKELNFARTLKIIQRTSNMLKGKDVGSKEIKKELFEDSLEGDLWSAYEAYSPKIRENIQNGDYAKATSLYAGAFFDILHAFFERVLVNAEKEDVRRNRFSLLGRIRDLYVLELADLSKIRTIEEATVS